jgi:DNA replication protein DnaC
MNEDLEQLLENLKLKTIAARFDEMLAAADQNGTPVPTLIAQLLRAEWHARQEQALQARIDRANFPEDWTLESFPLRCKRASRNARSAPSPNSTSSPKPRISFLSVKPALAKPD